MNLLKSWPFVSLLTAIGVVALVCVAFLLPTSYAVALLLLGVAVFVVMLLRNPAWRYWRMAVTIISGWLSANLLPSLLIKAKWRDDLLVDFWVNQDPGWAFNLTALVLAGLLILADVLLSREEGVVRSFTALFRSASNSLENSGGNAQQANFGDIGANATVNVTQHNGPSPDELAKLVQAKAFDANAEIDVAAERLRDGKPEIAIHLLTEMQKRHWDRLSQRERYRVVANLGHAAERQGEFRSAARHYIEAKSYQPDDIKAQCFEAVGYALLDDHVRAHAIAAEILKMHPDSGLATVVRLRCAPEGTPFSDLEQSVPTSLREDGEVVHALSIRAFKAGEHVAGERLARLAKSQHPNSPEVLEWFGAIVVQAQARAQQDERPVDTGNLNEAVVALSAALEKAHGKKGKAQIRYTRAEAYALLDRFDEAETDFRSAVELNPSDDRVALRFAMQLEMKGRREAAIEVLKRTIRDEVEVGNRVILANLLGFRNHPGDVVEALRLLRGTVAAASSEEERERASLVATLARLHCMLKQHVDAIQMLDGLPTGFISETIALVVRADVLSSEGKRDLAVSHARRAYTSLAATSSESDRLRVAHLLTALKEYRDALSVWKQIVRPTCADESVWGALECAKQAGDDSFILSFCAQLRRNGILDPYCLEVEVLIREKYRDYQIAIDLMTNFLKEPSDDGLARVFRVRRSLLGLRQDRPELIESDPTQLPLVESTRLDVGCATAHVLRKGPAPYEGVRYAYELLRRHYGSPDARQLYLGVFGVGEHKECDPLPASDVAGPGYAINYREEGSSEDKWVILEDSSNPSHERKEIGASHLLFKELSGKKIGDSFYVRRDDLQDRKGTVCAVMSKYGFRMKEILETWEDRFPDRPFLRKYTFAKKEDGSLDVAPFFQMLNRLEAQREQGRAFYREHPLSVATYAKMTNSGLLRSLQNLASEGTLRVRCCTGNGEEFEKATAAIQVSEILVIEPTALATLFFSNQYENISRLRMKCVVCESALEEYREFQKDMAFPKSGFSGKQGEKHLYWDDDPGARDRERARITTFLTRIRELATIESGNALAEIETEQRKSLIGMFGQPVAESIATAKRPKRVLWTDDMVAALCAGEHNVPSVWTQFVFLSHLTDGTVAENTYTELTLYLLNCRYFFTRLEPPVFLAACRHADWDVKAPPLMAAIGWFTLPEVLPIGLLQVGAAVLVQVWRESLLANRTEGVTRAIVHAVLKRNDGRAIATQWAKDIDQIFGLDVLNAERCRRCIEGALMGIGASGLIVPGLDGLAG